MDDNELAAKYLLDNAEAKAAKYFDSLDEIYDFVQAIKELAYDIEDERHLRRRGVYEVVLDPSITTPPINARLATQALEDGHE